MKEPDEIVRALVRNDPPDEQDVGPAVVVLVEDPGVGGHIEVRAEPRQEWKQIYEEAWRINRDFFYDPNMHGADWPAMKKKYEIFLPHLTSSADLYRVVRWMLSELAVGHSYITSYGERTFEKKTVQGGLLGADYELVDGRYKFKKIYGGLNWSAAMRSPLTAPGVNVREGEFLLAVSGQELKAPVELYSLFENTAGKLTELTVGPTADGKNSRTVTVEPIATEYNLRNMDWLENMQAWQALPPEKRQAQAWAQVPASVTASTRATSFRLSFIAHLNLFGSN